MLSNLFWGEVQTRVFPALSLIVTVQVAPLVAPVVQLPPATLIPLPPASSKLPLRVKVAPPEFLHGAGFGAQVPQVGGVVSDGPGTVRLRFGGLVLHIHKSPGSTANSTFTIELYRFRSQI